MARLLRALALAEQARAADAGGRRAFLAELDELVDWLSARASDAPANFGHLLRLVEAERAWADGDFRAAAVRFDLAVRACPVRAYPWHRALILERAGRFDLAHALDGAGHALLAAARRQYLDWGATVKVSQMDWAHPALRAETTSPVTPTVPSPGDGGAPLGSTITTGTLDLLGIIAASQALSSETTVKGLRAQVVGILREMTGATRIHFLLRDQGQDRDDRWLVPTDTNGTVTLSAASRLGLLPASIIWYAERTRGPVVVPDATRDDRFRRDPYLADLDRCSLLAIPVMIRGDLRAMLLLENQMIRGAFSADRLEGIMLITGQLAASLDNALIYSSLERKVTERTHQLAEANERLEQLSVTDPLTGLANRRRLGDVLVNEWHRADHLATPLGFAMIDVDHFKLYNDHFGHTAGDRCLQRVAACLASNIDDTKLAARYGGEEFAVVMPDTHAETANRHAQRLCAAVADLAEPHPRGIDRVVTVSIGVSTMTPTNGDDPFEHLVELADSALYRAKRGGRNRAAWAHAPPPTRRRRPRQSSDDPVLPRRPQPPGTVR